MAILMSDPNIVFSPCNWLLSGGVATTTFPGAYFKVNLVTPASASISIQLTTTALGANSEMIVSQVDAQQPVTTDFHGQSSITLASGLTAGTHTLQVWLSAMSTTVDAWVNSPPTTALIVNSLTSAGATTAAPQTYPGLMVNYGDSRSIGYDINATSTLLGGVTYQDASHCDPYLIASSFGCELGNIAMGGQGLCFAAPNGTPPIYTVGNDTLSSWNKLWAGQSRTFPSNVNYILLYDLGRNDSPNGISAGTYQAALTAFLPALRGAYGPRPIILMVPDFFGLFASNTLAAKNAYQASSGDPNVIYCPTPLTTVEQNSFPIPTTGPTALCPDTTHQSQHGTAILAARGVQALQAALSPSYGRVNFNGGFAA